MATLKTSLEADYDRQTGRQTERQTDRKGDLQGHKLPLCPKTKKQTTKDDTEVNVEKFMQKTEDRGLGRNDKQDCKDIEKLKLTTVDQEKQSPQNRAEIGGDKAGMSTTVDGRSSQNQETSANSTVQRQGFRTVRQFRQCFRTDTSNEECMKILRTGGNKYTADLTVNMAELVNT